MARQKAIQTRLAWLKVRGESPVRGTPRQRLTGQARRVRSPANVAGLSLILTGHAPTHMLCWDVPESIPAWNVAGTLSLVDCLRAVRTPVVQVWVQFGQQVMPQTSISCSTEGAPIQASSRRGEGGEAGKGGPLWSPAGGTCFGHLTIPAHTGGQEKFPPSYYVVHNRHTKIPSFVAVSPTIYSAAR